MLLERGRPADGASRGAGGCCSPPGPRCRAPGRDSRRSGLGCLPPGRGMLRPTWGWVAPHKDVIIHSLQHLHGGVTSLTTPDLPGELPPAPREATAHIRKVGLGVSQHPTSPSCHLLPAPLGDREKGAHPVPATAARCRDMQEPREGGNRAWKRWASLLRRCVRSQPAAGKTKKAPRRSRGRTGGQMGSAHAEPGLGSFSPRPFSHRRRLIAGAWLQLASKEEYPAMHPRLHIQVVEW